MNPLNHVAIIMDGNGRWGIKNKNSRNKGHKAGLLAVERIIKETIKNNIKYLTLYTFSTENWKRPQYEIKYLFKLMESFLSSSKLLSINEQNRGLKFLGYKGFSKKLNNLLNRAEKLTSKNTRLQINVALNYGSKFEILNVCKKFRKSNKKVNLVNFNNFLLTKNIPDPDLLIRTGDTKRLSNFLLWQLAYSEIFFEKKLWPDFNEKDYKKIINKFRSIKRNFGQI